MVLYVFFLPVFVLMVIFLCSDLSRPTDRTESSNPPSPRPRKDDSAVGLGHNQSAQSLTCTHWTKKCDLLYKQKLNDQHMHYFLVQMASALR